MTVGLLVLNALTIIVFVAVVDRRDRRGHEERQAHRLEAAGLVTRLEQAHTQASRERAGLLQRIQAPDVAVQEHATLIPVQTPEAVHATDDEDYWRAHAEQQDALEQIERLERELP